MRMYIKNYIKSFLVRVMWIFPIKRNRVIFWDFKGNSYGGNTRAVSDYLAKYKEIERIWVLKNHNEVEDRNVIFVSPKSLRYFYYVATSLIWVETHNFFVDEMPKRKQQIAIQTWHGALPIKTIEGLNSAFFSELQINNMKKSTNITDYLLSNGALSTKLLKKGMFYKGSVLEYGSPRCDILINYDDEIIKECKAKVRTQYDIPSNIDHFILYAPTYREDDTILVEKFDASRVCEAFRERFGGTWCCLFKLHPLSDNIQVDRTSVDVRHYNMVEELMLISDACITDYSSIIMDFMFTKKAAFFYACDYNEYKKSRGLCLNYSELPYPSSFSLDELIKNIKNYNVKETEKKIEHFCNKNCINENGRASESLGEFIYSLMNVGTTIIE